MVLSVGAGYSVEYVLREVGAGLEAADALVTGSVGAVESPAAASDRGAGAASAYYTGGDDTGEPPGLWWGNGARALGLSGVVDAETMRAVFDHRLDPRDPASSSMSTWGQAPTLTRQPVARATRVRAAYEQLLGEHPGAGPELRAMLREQADQSVARDNRVAFDDFTYSPPKSVTVVWAAAARAEADARSGAARARDAGQASRAGELEDQARVWAGRKTAIEEAVLAGHRAAFRYLEHNHCFVRTGKHSVNKTTGEYTGKWLDARGLVATQFLQHDSRDRDPQLHVHGPVLNAAQGSDGKWRGLDRATLKSGKWAASAMADRVMEARASALGLVFETRPDGKAREVVGVSEQSREVFSSRRLKITPAVVRLVAEFEAREGRTPTGPERDRLAQMATLATRSAKAKGASETHEQTLDRWAARHQAGVGGTLREVADEIFSQPAVEPARWSQRDVLARALAAVSAERQSWTRSDLIHEISVALPGNLGIGPEQVQPLLERLADIALRGAVCLSAERDDSHLPAQLRRDDGTSVLRSPAPVQYAMPEQLAGERALRDAAIERGAPVASTAGLAGVIDSRAAAGMALSQDQQTALRGIATSGAWLDVLTAPAGTGKSFLVGALAEAWVPVGKVRGIAFGQRQADVLTDEGVTARNIQHWLVGQQRLAEERPIDDDKAFRLTAGDLIVVDEAQLAGTDRLVEIAERVRAAGARLLLTGDPAQGGMGQSGALADLAESGNHHQLCEVRRFREEWERTASIGLREGDDSVLAEYDKHGRILDAGAREQAEQAAARAWLADTLRGEEPLVLVRSNEAAARLSAQLRAELVSLGRVEEQGVRLGMQGTFAGVGDLIQARKPDRGEGLVNRALFRVHEVREDGSLGVVPVSYDRTNGWQSGPARVIPADYVAQHVSLGYASTQAAAIGRTVDAGYAVIERGASRAETYVMCTRGRIRNLAFVVTQDPAHRDPASGETATAVRRDGLGVMSDVITRAPNVTEQTALAQQEQDTRVTESIPTAVEPLLATLSDLVDGRTARWLDELAADEIISDADRAAFAADPATRSLTQLLRRAELGGHHARQLLATALESRGLEGSLSVAQVTHSRVERAMGGSRDEPLHLSSFADLIPADVSEAYLPSLRHWAAAADARRHTLGAQAAEAGERGQTPTWATSLGPVPADVLGRTEWETKAGWAATWREQTASVAPLAEHDPLGAPPAAGMVEKRAMWAAAHHALDLAEAGAEEERASEGLLRARVRAWEREQAWAPRYVADQLAASHEAAQRADNDAIVWSHRAEVATDPRERAQLLEAAERAQMEADTARALIPDLEFNDDARASWYVHTAETRERAERAAAALRLRGVDPEAQEEKVSAQEWLDAHRADQAEDEQSRAITETDVDERAIADSAAIGDDAGETDVELDTAVGDIRETAQADPTETVPEKQPRRVPLADETADAVERAHVAAREIAARDTWASTQDDKDSVSDDFDSDLHRSARVNLYAWDDETAAEHDFAQVTAASHSDTEADTAEDG
jgi:hypothetical protein